MGNSLIRINTSIYLEANTSFHISPLPIDECTLDKEPLEDKYSGYTFFTANGIEYAAHPKLAQAFPAPNINHKTLRNMRNEYNNEENVKVLRVLGFDLYDKRCQGTDWVIEKRLANGITLLEPTWTQFSETEITSGRKVFLKRDEEILGMLINPKVKINSVLKINEFAIFNNRIPRPRKNPDKYKTFPRHLAENINRLTGKAVGLSQHSSTRCLMFDIDNHNFDDLDAGKKESDRVLNLLYKELGYPEEAMIEQSFSGGYHIAFLTTDYVNDNDSSQFVERFMKKYNVHLETRLTTKIFRIPGHFTYKLGYTFIEDGKVIFVPFDPTTAFDDYRSKVLAAEESEYRVDSSLFNSTSKYNQFGGTGSNLYRREKTFSVNPTPHYRPGDRYQLRAGDRNKNMIKLACTMARSGDTFEAYYNELNYADRGSRDWSSWSYEEKRAGAHRTWDKAEKYIGESWYGAINTSDKFYSSMEWIPDVLKPILKDKRVVSHFACIKGTSYQKNRARILSDTEIILNETIGKMYYEAAHPRQVYADVSPEYKANLENGTQFPRNRIQRLKKAYNMKSDAIGIERNILNNKTLFTQYKHNNLGYKFKWHKNDTAFCKQFHIKGTNPDTKDSNVLTARVILALRSLIIAQRSGQVTLSGIPTPNLNMCEVLENKSIIVPENEAQFYRCSSPPDNVGIIQPQGKPEINRTLH